jgi:hypothetical protein
MKNSFYNFSRAPANNTLTITEVMIRSANGVAKYPDDTAPPRPAAREITLDYPRIAAQPEYLAETEKLNRFYAQMEKAEKDLAAMRAELDFAIEKQRGGRNEEGAISKAEKLLTEEKPRDLDADMRAKATLIEALRNAIDAQHTVLRHVNQALSRAAGQRYSDEHKERVKRVMAAVIELNEANKAELFLRDDLNRLGYTGEALPTMTLLSVEDPSLVCENMTYYWYEDAKKYVQTDAQIAAGVRKARLAALGA